MTLIEQVYFIVVTAS